MKLFPSEKVIVKLGKTLEEYSSLKNFCEINKISITPKLRMGEFWFSRFNPKTDNAEFQILKVGYGRVVEMIEKHDLILDWMEGRF